MKKSETYTFIALSLVFLMMFGVANLRITDLRDVLSYRLQVSAAPLPTTLLNALAGEFKGVAADYLLMEAASFIGGNEKPDEGEWAAIARLLEQSSILDPYFKQTYIVAQGTLPWHAQKYEETLTILERSRRHRTWDWRPGFFIGFNHFYFYNDNAAASEALMEASRVPGAPPTLATWASRLASKAGHYQTAIDFLAEMYESTEDVQQREMLMKRITAVRGAYVLQQAVDRFNEQFGTLPNCLDELVEKDILPELPVNPYKRDYALNEGRVEF